MKSKKIRFFISIILSGLTLFLVIFSVGNYFYKNVWVKQNAPKSKSITPSGQPVGGITLRGMVWTGGLSIDEKRALNIQSDYQITKTFKATGWEGKMDGAYLLKGKVDPSIYLGKCVELTGNIVKGWEDIANNNYEINGKWTYNRSAFEPTFIKPLDLTDCVADFDTLTGNVNRSQDRNTVTGTLFFSDRPAPDISYDIELIPDKPFIDEFSSAGGPAEVKKLDVSAGTNLVYKKLLDNIGKKVEISGYMQWGYSESRYLLVDELVE